MHATLNPKSSAPGIRRIPWHRRLEARLLICVTLIAGLALEAAQLAADRIVTSHSMQRSSENLRAAQAVFYRLARQNAEFASTHLRLIAELPLFRANIETGNAPTVGAVAEYYRRKLRAEFCLVTDSRGRWLAKPGWPAAGDPQAVQTALEAARDGQSYQGTMAVGGRLYLVVCEPAHFGEEILGTLTAGYRLDDAAAVQLSRVTGCEVTFVSGQRLCGSSLDREGKAALESALKLPISQHQRDAPVFQQWGGQEYVGLTCSLSPGSTSLSARQLLLLQNWEPTQEFLDEVKRALAAVFGLAFACSLAGGLVVSRRITQPLRQMVAVAEAVAGGDWERQADTSGSSEVAVMAAAFNDMTANLRHWRHEAERHAERLAETLAQLQQAHQATLEALCRALDARDNETEGHSLRVTHYATCLARQMMLEPMALSALHWGALLHDIGKIGVPDAILYKPGRLTDEEMRQMQRHCEFGLQIVRGIPYLEQAAAVIGCHHERYDGKGYPHGLAGAQIPLAARIFSVADTLDAITSDRPYRRATPFPAALTEIQRHSGTQFDPHVVRALEPILDSLAHWRHEAQPPPTASFPPPEAVMLEVSF